MTLPPPEPFERKQVTGYLTDRISIGKKDDSVAIVLTNPDEPDHTLIFQTSAAGARQVAASLLNQADVLDPDFDIFGGAE
jgi:hypothetical protein